MQPRDDDTDILYPGTHWCFVETATETADSRRQFAANASGEVFPSESAAVCHLQSAVYFPVETK